MIETYLEYQLRTKKQVRATIRKEGSHYVVSIGGRGMVLAPTKEQAKRKQAEYRKQIRAARRKGRR